MGPNYRKKTCPEPFNVSRPCMSNHRRYPNTDNNMSRRPNNPNNGWGQSEELLNGHLESQMDELGNTVDSLRTVRFYNY